MVSTMQFFVFELLVSQFKYILYFESPYRGPVNTQRLQSEEKW